MSPNSQALSAERATERPIFQFSTVIYLRTEKVWQYCHYHHICVRCVEFSPEFPGTEVHVDEELGFGSEESTSMCQGTEPHTQNMLSRLFTGSNRPSLAQGPSPSRTALEGRLSLTQKYMVQNPSLNSPDEVLELWRHDTI